MTLYDEIQAVNTAIVAGGDYQAIADSVNAARPFVITQFMIGERGIIAILGTIEGEACLQAFEAFSSTPLPEGHPLAPHYQGVKRLLAWLKTDAGVDIGNDQAHTLLNVMVQVGILQQSWVNAMLSLTLREPEKVSAAQVASVMTGGA